MTASYRPALGKRAGVSAQERIRTERCSDSVAFSAAALWTSQIYAERQEQAPSNFV